MNLSFEIHHLLALSHNLSQWWELTQSHYYHEMGHDRNWSAHINAYLGKICHSNLGLV